MPREHVEKPVNKKPRIHKRIHAQTSHHYRRVMPDQKRHRVMIWVAFLSISTLLAIQLLYPVNRTLPLASLFGEPVSMKTDVELAKIVSDKFLETRVTLKASDDLAVTAKLGDMGVEPDTAAMTNRLVEYPFWQRFIPLSILFRMPRVDTAIVTTAPSVARSFSDMVVSRLSKDPIGARLSIEHGELTAINEQPGISTTPESVAQVIKRASYRLGRGNSLKVPVVVIEAETTSRDFVAVRAKAEAALARPLSIRIGEHEFTPTSEERANWLLIESNERGQVALMLDQTRVSEYGARLNEEVAIAPGQTNVSLRDGRQIGQTTGTIGKTIDQAQLLAGVEQWLLYGDGDGVLQAQLVDVAPTIIYDNKYTSTEEGLQAYVADAAKKHSANIVVQQVDGRKWSARDSADLSIPSASTYKLYVAKILFDKMDRGETSWNDSMLGATVTDCFDQMTIASTNACSQEWLSRWGRQYANDYVWRLGFSRGTSFTEPDAVHTTATDLAKFMTGLENGSLVSGLHRDRLLKSLSTHPYRYGIPTGSKGQVYDKVGFLWDYVHDAAIVYHPQGKYVMVVMTKGRSYGTIATITREVERIMYP